MHIAALLVATLAISGPAAGSDERIDRLSATEQDWLQQEVVYIITDPEKDVFLSLESLEERERFIEAFWRKRDPNPTTPLNEFREEHERRLDHANRFLGRETYLRGWQTDRGRYHILLGEPISIQRYEGNNDVFDTELWFYQGDLKLALPSHFYLIFFRPYNSGQYQLYHPVVDGPAALVRRGPSKSSRDVLDRLRQISPELASASLSYDPSDPADHLTGRASMGTDRMLARIEELPKRAVRTDYIDAWLRYRNAVSAEYYFNFVPSRSSFSVLVGPEAMALVHFSVELDPESFAVEANEDQTKFYTTLDVTVEARSLDGLVVLSQDNEAYIELNRRQFDDIHSVPFAYYGVIPLIPGDFQVSVILRNRVMQRYSVAEREVHIEAIEADTPTITDVVLAHDRELVNQGENGTSKSFRIGSVVLQPAAEGLFTAGETAFLFAQVSGATPEHKVSFDLLDSDGKRIRSIEPRSPSEEGIVIESMRLDGISGDRYRLRAQLLSSTHVAAESYAPLVVSPLSHIPRPGFHFRHGFRASVPGIWALIRGEQLLNMGRTIEARAELEQAVASGKRQLPIAWWKLAEVCLRENQPDRALELLTPMEEAFSTQYEVIAGLGFGYHQKGDFRRSLEYLLRAGRIRPADTQLWNALGEAHEKLGDLKAAREAFERSIELNPEQERTKARLAALADRTSR